MSTKDTILIVDGKEIIIECGDIVCMAFDVVNAHKIFLVAFLSSCDEGRRAQIIKKALKEDK